MLVVSLVAGVIGTAGALNSGNVDSAVSEQETELNEQDDVQEPSYTSSITAPDNSMTEEDEAQELAKYATISQKTAEDAALNEVPGTLGEVELENENGNVVYSVEVQTSSGNMDVKVDAGNGQVLCIETDDED